MNVLRNTAASMLVAMSVWVVAGPASAVVSTWRSYGPILTITYQNRAGLVAGPNGSAYVKANKTIPAGYSGSDISLYKAGALCASSNFIYKSSSTAANTAWSNNLTYTCGKGNYTARGSTGAYNGSGYNYHYTGTSPILAN